MVLNKEEIIKICTNNLATFKNSIKNMKYELKGIFNSEMLLFISLTHYFGVKLIIESGRARGQSTKIIAENFNKLEYKIYSIEYNRYSSDVKHSFNRLKQYKNVNLFFGDSFELIPNLITEKCCILIDGPKDTAAINLGIECLENPLVKAVFIHDMSKDSLHRIWVEKIFSNYFFTDDSDYVAKFKILDKPCWFEHRKLRECRTCAPYRIKNKVSKSYFATLSVIFNSNNFHNPNTYSEYLKYLDYLKGLKKSWKIRFLIDNWPRRIKNIIQFPISYIYYEKRISRKKKLDLTNLMTEWTKVIFYQFRSMFKKRIVLDYDEYFHKNN